MNVIKVYLFLVIGFTVSGITAQTVVKMDMPQQADFPLEVVALFDEEIPEGIPIVLGLMGYDVEGGITPFLFEWTQNGDVVSTTDIVIFTPAKGDDLSLTITDKNKCRATTSFNLKVASIAKNSDETIEVYPTIVTDYIYINVPQFENKKALVRIFGITGEIAHEEYVLGNTRMNINLSSGAYFVSVRMGVVHKVEKIIVR